DFYLGEFLVTQELWEAVTGENPSRFQGACRPVERVSWNDIEQVFLPALREKTGQNFRLPSEAEWEYAARGGPFWQSEVYRYAGSDKIEQVGWYDQNSGRETQEVGRLLPNALGLYDLSGNLWEWCADTWHDNYREAPNDGSAWMNGGDAERAVLRGGSWNFNDSLCRPGNRLWCDRNNRNYYIGFRCARAV
ncbi:MAG: formylglycine-generating enzyme family protein, partial [Saprospiraceae bacterium]|nr:formylglycine-generating enzyme family protein [Saprospiraceae bacterium]